MNNKTLKKLLLPQLLHCKKQNCSIKFYFSDILLITEATYEADTHPARNTQETALLSAIASVVEARGNVLIPAFALGRAQEILLALRTSAEFRKLVVPTRTNSLVLAVTNIFTGHCTSC